MTGVAVDAGTGADVAEVELTVVVPAYNEEHRLGPTLRSIADHLRKSRFAGWELIVVDDGSTDGTRAVAEAAAAEEPSVHVVSGDVNHGKGHALRLGVCASYGRRVLVTDADLATPIEELDRLDRELTEAGATAVIGSRALPGASIETHQHLARELLGRGGNFLIRAVAVPGIKDTQCGFKLFDGDRAREAFAATRVDGWAIDVEVLQYFRRKDWPLAEVPVRWAHQEGSKVRPRDYAGVLAELAALRTRRLPGRGRRPRAARDPRNLAVAGLFLLAAFLLQVGRWVDPGGRYLPDSLQDQNQWEWFFAVTADNVLHLRNPLFTDLQGFPDGVNLMANTVMLGLSVPFAPITELLGPAVSLALVMTLGLAATAYAWYWLIRRRLDVGRAAAVTGAALAAFAPPMVSHANAHPNFVVLFMLPLIVDRALRLCEGTRVVRDGVLLGLFTAYQVFLGEEPLLLAAMGLLLFAIGYAVVRRDVAREAIRPLARGVGIALAVFLPIVAFPLWWQFFGPGSYHSVLHGDGAGNSPLALLSFAERSLAGDRETADGLALNITEQNAFYGWPLVLLAFAIVVRLWERPVVKALAWTALAAAVLSLGPEFRIPGTDTVLTGPWRALAHQPLFESVIESRVAMVCAPALGMLVALGIHQLVTARGVRRPHRVAGLAAVAAALLPIVPGPLHTVDRAEVPEFVADGTWRDYVDTAAGESLVPVPLPDPGAAEALHWQTTAGLGFRLPGGYFNGPYGEDRKGIYGAVPRHTSNLLREVAVSGRVPQLSKAWREQARADLEFWRAGALVVAPQRHTEALRATLEGLLGRKGTWIGGVLVWDLQGGS
ncbi:Undecaprenyl-phosphate mannosyltransferase [Streptomyces sp. YIM 130001]|uniref:dolichyl-phosphate beta-glucosyltransferase n=1 Tax=Streptomyces sp. YIM 130001 TaxID=2259644 RepID=UPI000E65919D|nr:dolichyl-phosphate beta-glucosyltransferase [Streptomyces sp. YIM 130001]RII09167.1 Undecaprenyl-phosphate mannosyltransferase [Streptomyces sp. YIM 130001]